MKNYIKDFDIVYYRTRYNKIKCGLKIENKIIIKPTFYNIYYSNYYISNNLYFYKIYCFGDKEIQDNFDNKNKLSILDKLILNNSDIDDEYNMVGSPIIYFLCSTKKIK